MEPEQQSAWENLVRSVVGFPKYIVEWTVGLIVAILTDLHITTLAITAALGGVYYHNALLGLLLFFVLYSASRVAGVIANSIGFGLQGVAETNARVAGAILAHRETNNG
jgi:hypothetical protein